MKKVYVAFSTIITIGILLAISMVVAADDRVNQAHHFGGDALFCDMNVGCWMLDSSGTELWAVSQSTIDDVMTLACETGTSQVIEAGVGTYGEFWIEVSCYEGVDPSLTLVGYDEHSKINRMQFSSDYIPVFAAPVITPTPEPTVAPVTPTPPVPCAIKSVGKRIAVMPGPCVS